MGRIPTLVKKRQFIKEIKTEKNGDRFHHQGNFLNKRSHEIICRKWGPTDNWDPWTLQGFSKYSYLVNEGEMSLKNDIPSPKRSKEQEEAREKLSLESKNSKTCEF